MKNVRKMTDSGIPIDPVYRDPHGLNSKIGEPGSYPFTRGIYPSMYRDRFWTMRQYSGFGDAQDTNRRFKYLLEQGQTGLSVAFDLPTQLGFDSDSKRAFGEVGKVGVAISSSENMETLFDSIPIDQVSTSMTINSTASIMLAMYIALAESRGIEISKLRGTTQNDMLKEYVARNTYIFPPDKSFRLCVDIISFCAEKMPKWHPISISGYHMREAGANAVQELAFTFADAIEYVNAVVKRGLQIDAFCDKLSFFFACRNDFVEEIAKFRAARRIWANIVKERFGSTNEESMKIKYHVQTSGEALTAQQPLNNAIRVAIQALSAVLGGMQSLHTNSYDEALGLPTEKAVTIALRTQQIIAEESGIVKTADPVGGAYYIEKLTDEIEARVLEELNRVDKLGGSLAAIKVGYIQNEIQNSAYKFQKEIDEGKRTIVGVNRYTTSEKGSMSPQRVSESSVKRQVNSLKKYRASRNKKMLESLLGSLSESSQSEETNLMDSIIAAVKSGATTGEISDTLRESFGEYRGHMWISERLF